MKQNGAGARTNGEILDAGMPSDEHCEQMLLRSCLLLPRVIDEHQIEAADFHHEPHAEIFGAMAALRENLQPVDLTNLHRELTRTDRLKAVGGAAKLAEIITGDALPSNTSYYLRVARDCRAKREGYLSGVAFLRDLRVKPFAEAYAHHRDNLDGIAADSQGFRIDVTPSPAFAATNDVATYAIEGILAERQPMVVAAQLKGMKSTICVAMGIALASGEPFLGRFSVARPYRVLIANAESGGSTLRETGERIASAQGTTLAQLGNLFWTTVVPRLDAADELAALRRALVRERIEIAIVDPLYFMLAAADAGNLMAVGRQLRQLSGMCEEIGITLVVVHHIRKSGIDNRHAPPELTQVSWSGTSEWARQWLLLSRRRDYEPGTGEHHLWMVTGGSAGHSGLHGLQICEGTGSNRTWHVLVLEPSAIADMAEAAKEQRADQKRAEGLERDVQLVVEACHKLPGHQGTKTDIRARTGRNGQAFDAALAAALDAGHLEPCEIAKANSRRYEGYRVVDDEN